VRALLLAAGLGTRLRPITDSTPKCLVPILGKPLLEFWLDLLLSGGIERVLINTHYLPHRVEDFAARSPWKDRIDLVYEPTLLGTGGTILQNKSYFRDEGFLVAHADNLTDFDVQALVRSYETRPPDIAILMMTFHTDTPASCGIVVENADGVVVQFHEKTANPPGNLANGAVYIFAPEIPGFLARLGKPIIDLSTQVIPHFLGRIKTFRNDSYLRDIGTLDSLELAEREFPLVQLAKRQHAPVGQ
jgi:mannose-1-phosphate guanylyltransferase